MPYSRELLRTQSQESQHREETSMNKNRISNNTRKMNKYSTGTDGCRVLCRQFSTSSFSLLAYCIKRCSTYWLRMNQLGKAILLFSSTDDQGQNTRTTVFPLNCGRQWYISWWSRKNPSALWQPHLASRMKRSVASCIMSNSSVDDKERSYALTVL